MHVMIVLRILGKEVFLVLYAELVNNLLMLVVNDLLIIENQENISSKNNTETPNSTPSILPTQNPKDIK